MSQSPRLWFVTLLIAAIDDCGLALYHFMLPYQFGWSNALKGVADTLVWALFALNFSWSVLVFLMGVLVLYLARLGPAAGKFAKVTLFAVGLFWAIHGAYTWLNPFPLPPSLLWVRWPIDAFPAIALSLHWLPLVVYRRRPDA